ncbi:MAG: hypothetical protein IFK94_04045 [Acidobacteria bacterium]|uniref:Uncharacterized protein n=1 Tax=Candidatus Polarisedimenticola svalbardensis TaxID=2886004 RepID=A0A8J6XYR5_9BACT|nr:hypothetical protein [Candidatus Polarisedimenticola svalbardensis]
MIKLIKVVDTDGMAVHFNPEHVTHVQPASNDTSVITFTHGEKVEVKLHVDDVASRITRA